MIDSVGGRAALNTVQFRLAAVDNELTMTVRFMGYMWTLFGEDYFNTTQHKDCSVYRTFIQ